MEPPTTPIPQGFLKCGFAVDHGEERSSGAEQPPLLLPEQSPLLSSVQEGGGGERSDRTQAELGRLLTLAAGYRVLASDART